MHGGFQHNPALTIALAMAAGVIAQSLGRHLRIPGIVLLLAAGVGLGPDLANVIQPETLGHALEMLTGFAVAVILFDGGLNLHLGRMRKQAPAIRRLLTLGVVVTTLGGVPDITEIPRADANPPVCTLELVDVMPPFFVSPSEVTDGARRSRSRTRQWLSRDAGGA